MFEMSKNADIKNLFYECIVKTTKTLRIVKKLYNSVVDFTFDLLKIF